MEIWCYLDFGENADCPCVMIYKPVCGRNGVTYSNICILNCEKVQFAYLGNCQKSNIGENYSFYSEHFR